MSSDSVLTVTPNRLVLDLPGLELVNPLNRREHWTARRKRAETHRETVCLATWREIRRLRRSLAVGSTRPKRIVFECWRPRRFDDDAIPAALKHLRDGLQDAGLIHHDGPKSGHVFVYAPMQIGPPRVRITVTLA